MVASEAAIWYRRCPRCGNERSGQRSGRIDQPISPDEIRRPDRSRLQVAARVGRSSGATPHMSFESLGLLPELLKAVEAEGYTEPTPVQAEAIPHILAHRDVLAGAQTGTGKTAAFVLPILQLLHSNRPTPRHPIRESGAHRGRRPLGVRPQIASGLPIRCLVLAPTRELAIQVEEFVQAYSRSR